MNNTRRLIHNNIGVNVLKISWLTTGAHSLVADEFGLFPLLFAAFCSFLDVDRMRRYEEGIRARVQGGQQLHVHVCTLC